MDNDSAGWLECKGEEFRRLCEIKELQINSDTKEMSRMTNDNEKENRNPNVEFFSEPKPRKRCRSNQEREAASNARAERNTNRTEVQAERRRRHREQLTEDELKQEREAASRARAERRRRQIEHFTQEQMSQRNETAAASRAEQRRRQIEQSTEEQIRQLNETAAASRAEQRRRQIEQSTQEQISQRNETAAASRAEQRRRQIEQSTAEQIRQLNESAAASRAESRRRQQQQQRNGSWNIARISIDLLDENEIQEHFCGAMDQKCKFCDAQFWEAERTAKGMYSTCCNQGAIKLNPIHPPPPFVKEILLGQSSNAKIFKKKAQLFNSKVSFASVGLNQAQFPTTRGVPAIRISGNVYHKIGSIFPDENYLPKYMQCFFYKHNNHQSDSYLTENETSILNSIRLEIEQCNPFLRSMRQALETHQEVPLYRLVISDVQPINAPARTYNVPTSSEVAAIIVGAEDSNNSPNNREVVIQLRGGGLRSIPSTHTSYDPLAYVITHMYGDKGWTWDIPKYQLNEQGQFVVKPNSHVTAVDYYAYRMHTRDPKGANDIVQDTLTFGGMLKQQYDCDNYVKIEQQRLHFQKTHQKQLKAEFYSGLQDAVAANEHRDAGKYVILSSSFVGSPRHNHQCYQDAMAAVRRYGKPDLFITFTCNPKWKEIVEHLRPGESPQDRNDLIARVFKMKLSALMTDLTKNNFLGKSIAHTQVIEFQKRGLPHAHILIILAETDKPTTVDDYDTIVCAEIPDPERHPKLYALVTKHMIHGPCGDFNPCCVCMDKDTGRCTKHFPKSKTETTTTDEDSYPLYRRRCQHSYRTNKGTRGVYVDLDDTWVVPYNPYLLLKYNCHINVEICNSVSAVKYLYKYVYKGYDKASVTLVRAPADKQNNTYTGEQPKIIDEIQRFVDSRFIGASEAVWRTLCFDMSDRYPSITRLQLHDENQHTVFYQEGEEIEALERERLGRTTLTAFLDCCQKERSDPLPIAELGKDEQGNPLPRATDLTYLDFPSFYTWDGTKRKWNRRKRPFKSDTIGRIYTAHPSSGDKFYLRMLLCKVKGPTSFQQLKTFGGQIYHTYKEACLARGIVAEDSEWKECLTEAAAILSPKHLRDLFVYILHHNQPASPLLLWNLQLSNGEILSNTMSEDFRYLASQGELDTYENFDLDHCLSYINDSLQVLSNYRCNIGTYGLPMPSRAQLELCPRTREIDNELKYDAGIEDIKWKTCYGQFNSDQKFVFDTIDAATHGQQQSHIFFVDAPGGTGKTFLFNALLSKWRSTQKIVVAVASSGIAAILLEGGKTAHSRFGIPLQVLQNSSCSVTNLSAVGKMLLLAHAIVWDEAPMASKYCVECVDRFMRQLMHLPNIPFGGKNVVFGGDFRQTLPVFPKQGRAGIVANTIKKCSFWDSVVTLRLTINERVRRNGQDTETEDFSVFLQQVGDGSLQYYPELGKSIIRIPEKYLFLDGGVSDLIDWCYPSLRTNSSTCEYNTCAILAAKNSHVDQINLLALGMMEGQVFTFNSSDSVKSDREDEAILFPPEYLNTINASGLPPHELKLKIGAPAILIRNIDPAKGLCNGTRVQIKQLSERLIKVQLLNGTHSGTEAWIPRMDLPTPEGFLPFILNRRQFPLKLAFAMTINKAQGQSLTRTAIWLKEPLFAHGQLYVALSRSGVPSQTKVLIEDVHGKQGHFHRVPGIYTANIVYQEVLSE